VAALSTPTTRGSGKSDVEERASGVSESTASGTRQVLFRGRSSSNNSSSSSKSKEREQSHSALTPQIIWSACSSGLLMILVHGHSISHSGHYYVHQS
jgi:hypothetical protein